MYLCSLSKRITRHAISRVTEKRKKHFRFVVLLVIVAVVLLLLVSLIPCFFVFIYSFLILHRILVYKIYIIYAIQIRFKPLRVFLESNNNKKYLFSCELRSRKIIRTVFVSEKRVNLTTNVKANFFRK